MLTRIGENAIFLIKHNTDYIHYTFIKKRKYIQRKTPKRFDLNASAFELNTRTFGLKRKGVLI